MQISMMTYTMARGEWGQNPDIETLCRLCKELNIEAIDWVTTHGNCPTEIRRITDDFGLKNICYTFSGDQMQVADNVIRQNAVLSAEQELDTAITLGADKVMVVLPGIPDVSREESRKWCHESLNKLVEMGKSKGIIVTTEHFPSPWSPFHTSEDMNLAIREVPGFKVTYDNGNVMLGGEKPADGFINSYEHVVHAHFKDWAVSSEGIKASDGTIYKGALIGEGVVDPLPCLVAMKQYGYDGCINLEYEGNDYTPEEAMRKATPLLKDMIKNL